MNCPRCLLAVLGAIFVSSCSTAKNNGVSREAERQAIAAVETRIAELEKRLSGFEQRFSEVERWQTGALEKRLTDVERRFGDLDVHADSTDRQLASLVTRYGGQDALRNKGSGGANVDGLNVEVRLRELVTAYESQRATLTETSQRILALDKMMADVGRVLEELNARLSKLEKK